MSWRSAAACWALALLLAGIYLTGSTNELASSARDRAAPTPTPEPAYALDVQALETVDLERAGKRVRLARRGDAWEIVEPAGTSASPGLLDALVTQLVEGSVGEHVAAAPRDLGAYGLRTPRLVVTATEGGGRRVTLAVGDRDPTETAAYGQVIETGDVLLVGVSLLTYADLLFDAAR